MGVNAPGEAGLPARFVSQTLRPGIHAALADNRIVILDVERDRYLRIDRRRSLSLTTIVNTEVLEITAALAARGLTTEPARAQPGARSLNASAFESRAFDASKLPGVLAACVWAARTQKRLEFAGLLRAVRRPRQLRDKRLLPSLVENFLHCRPLYPKDYACMFEALALLRYLAQRGHWASWVFGVRGAPFAAHCWLERDGVVLNDEPDAVAPYARIMAV